jgi:hypothetical protein
MSRYDDLRRMREATACTHKSRLFGNRWLPQTTCADGPGSSGNLPPPSPPAALASYFFLKYPATAQGANHKIAAAHFYQRVRDLPLP